jgi:hypothetical protein
MKCAVEMVSVQGDRHTDNKVISYAYLFSKLGKQTKKNAEMTVNSSISVLFT